MKSDQNDNLQPLMLNCIFLQQFVYSFEIFAKIDNWCMKNWQTLT